MNKETITIKLVIEFNPHVITSEEVAPAIQEILEAHEWTVVECD